MADAMLSSPDPLHDTPTFQAAQRPRRSSKARSSIISQASSPKKQTFELDVGDQISPQKIRVTVEAGDSDTQNDYTHNVQNRRNSSPSKSRAPKNRRRERTTTTTVPVKGLSDSEEEPRRAATPKRGRGRPRKSIGDPVSAKRHGRASTPIRSGYSRRKSVDDSGVDENEEDGSFQIGEGVVIKRGKRGSRSRSRSTIARKSTPVSKLPSSSGGISSTASKKGRGRRKTLASEEVAVLEDIRNETEIDEVRTPVEMGGALQPIDLNKTHTSSTGVDESGAILDWFVPNNGTPREANCTDSSTKGAQKKSIRGQQHDGFESDKSVLTHYDDSVALISPTPSDNHQCEARPFEGACEDGEEQDGIGEMREFDTIIESEGFSMISVDSVPSLREHLSSPAAQGQTGESVKLTPKNKNLLSVQEAPYEDSFSSIPEDVLEAATPGRRVENSHLLSAPSFRVDDTFSSISPEILAAATPAKPSKAMTLAQKTQAQDQYEDSFSAIPEEILKAATPAPKTQALKATIGPAGGALSDGLKVASLKLDMSRSPTSYSTRLPTPEETPSPLAERVEEAILQEDSRLSPRSSERNVEEGPLNEASIVHTHMPSSPPSIAPRRYTYTAHLRNYRQLHPDSTETPSIVFSSPSLPPPIQQRREQAIPRQGSEQSPRPALSPVTRAGRALQDIAVPSSPRNRSQSLGSPFKSPIIDRKSSSVTKETQPSLAQDQPSRAVPRLRLNNGQAGVPSDESISNGHAHEDPFNKSNNGVDQHLFGAVEKQQYNLGLPDRPQSDLSKLRLATIRSQPSSIRSDDVMSWQAEEQVFLSNSPPFKTDHFSSPVNSGLSSSQAKRIDSQSTWEKKDAAERASVRQRIESASASEVIVLSSDEEAPDAGQIDDDESFDLLLETISSSSPMVEERSEPPRGVLEKPRRSKIPSPWRKNSKRLVYNDELSHISSPILSSGVGTGKNLAADSTTSKTETARTSASFHRGSDDTHDSDLSGWQIPQKSNFQPRARESGNLDLSALLSMSPAKQLPVLSTSSRTASSHHDAKSDPSPSTETSRQPTPDSTASVYKRREKPFVSIPQKQDFTPRPHGGLCSSPVKPAVGLFSQLSRGTVSNSQPKFSSSPSQPLAPSPSNRSNPPAQQSTSPAFLDHSASSLIATADKENHLQQQAQKWAESVRLVSTPRVDSQNHLLQVPNLTSPTKSILRSPLKSSSMPSSSDLSPSKAVTFVSSSPMPSSPPPQPLSGTTWSKDHWQLLDRILQSWKPENDLSSNSDKSGSTGKRRNSTRVVSRLLGRKVHDAEGKSMLMEQWHLEAVDEFREQVSGWEEKGVAMRVFALLIGEEKRARGSLGRRGGHAAIA